MRRLASRDERDLVAEHDPDADALAGQIDECLDRVLEAVGGQAPKRAQADREQSGPGDVALVRQPPREPVLLEETRQPRDGARRDAASGRELGERQPAIRGGGHDLDEAEEPAEVADPLSVVGRNGGFH